jgi:hypothetical protein
VPTISDPDDIAARLSRMKLLVEELERVCSESIEQRDALARLRLEMEGARRELKLPTHK